MAESGVRAFVDALTCRQAKWGIACQAGRFRRAGAAVRRAIQALPIRSILTWHAKVLAEHCSGKYLWRIAGATCQVVAAALTGWAAGFALTALSKGAYRAVIEASAFRQEIGLFAAETREL